MRYLVLADIHANLEALEAVLGDASVYDQVVCLGDTIGYGASPNECVERVRELPGLVCLLGNHDLAALGRLDIGMFNDYAAAAATWTGRVLAPEARAYLDALEPALAWDDIYLAHASPLDPVWEYMEYEYQGPPNFAAFQQALCLVGHTHVPRVFQNIPGRPTSQVSSPRPGSDLSLDGARLIVNPGGVGQPRDRDPRAAYGLLDTAGRTFTFRRVEYPVDIAQQKILDAGLPEILAQRLAVGL